MATIGQQSIQLDQDNDHVNESQIALILFSLDGRAWLDRDDERTHSLPMIWIPKWTRVAQEAIKAASAKNLDIFCLWERREGEDHYLIARINNPTRMGSDLDGFRPEELSTVIQDENVQEVVAAAHVSAFRSDGSSTDGPLKRIDWDIQLQEQLQPTLNQRGVRLTGRTHQLNASETFSLLRLDTSGFPIWFKAVGAPNLAEYSVTLAISEMFPGTTPPLIACVPEWNGWVAEDTGGKRLDSSSDIEDWKKATIQLADLQVSSLQRVDDLFRAGCTDCRAESLLDHVDLFVEAMQRAMTEDQDLNTARLDRGQIDQVAHAVRTAITETVDLRLPDALVHRDLSGGNIQRTSAGCYFIDWAQACIGFPFICSEYMKVHLATVLGKQENTESQVAELSEAYASRWRGVLTPEQMMGALKHAPILAEYLYVTPMDGRTAFHLLRTREHRAMMRSMVRRMWRELQIDLSNAQLGKEARYA